MGYLCFCDYEGTLTGINHTVSETTIQQLKDFLNGNHLCVLSYASVQELYTTFHKQGIPCDLYSMSSSSGIFQNQEVTYTLDSTILNSILSKHKEIIYTAYMVYLDEVYIYHYQERLLPLYPKGTQIKIDTLSTPVSNATIAVNKPNTGAFYKDLQAYHIPYTILASDKNRDMVFLSKIPSKANLIEELSKIYPNQTTVGIGDSISDYDFISKCEIQIAMKNADEKLKQLCRYTTKLKNIEDGCSSTLLELKNTGHL